MLRVFLCIAMMCLSVVVVKASDPGRRVVIYDGIATEIGAPDQTPGDLWVTMKDLKRATRFEVKPQGVCRDELCFPLPKSRRAEFISKKRSVTWFNLSEFARLINQAVAYDQKHQVWYFGPLPEGADGRLASLEAPDFTLPDINGKLHSLSGFRGKKVLLVTWASW